jgi:YHS domain-containing protein
MKKFIGSLLFFLILSFGALAQKSEVFNTTDGAIHGYDPVAYFKESKAVMGDRKYSVTWNSAVWYFSNQKNLELFKADPQLYAPQYGGYCAYGLAEGHKAPTDPQAWTIADGKLYLNYSKDVQQSWKKDETGYIIKANKLWPALKDKE